MTIVSVVVPTYNRAALLDRLLTAMEAQVPPAGGHEVIVVDDGSIDDTPSVVAKHADVRYWRQSNAGPAAARNLGWRMARSQFIAFTDDDTVPTTTWLQELVDSGRDLDAVGGRVEPLVPGVLADFVGLERLVGHGADDSGFVRYLATVNCLWRKDALERLGGFDESFPSAAGEDADLTLRARSAGLRLGVVDVACVRHDHRASLLEVLKTYRKHGQARRLVVTRNPDANWDERRRAMFSTRYWVLRYHYYRAAVPAHRAIFYLVLRALGSVAYVAGILIARCRR